MKQVIEKQLQLTYDGMSSTIPSSILTTDSNGNVGSVPFSSAGIIEKTKSEIDDLISNSALTAGATYKITGTHVNLYNDGTDSGTAIYIKALSEIKLASDGYGEFYNPKYNQDIDGYGIWMDDILSFTQGGPVSYQEFLLTDLGVSNNVNNNSSGPLVVDALGNKYIGNYGNGRIYKMDSTNTLSDFSGGGGGKMVITSTNEIIVIATGTSLYRISTAGSISIFANVGAGASSICIDDQDTVYVYCSTLGDVYKITSGGTVSNLGVVGAGGTAICVDNEFKDVYVSTTANIFRINTAGQILQHGNFQNVAGMAVGPVGSRFLYISTYNDANIIRLFGTGATPTVIGNVSNTGAMIAADSQNNVYAGFNTLYKITPSETILIQSFMTVRDIYVDKFDNAYVSSTNRLYEVESSSIDYPTNFYDGEFVESDAGDSGYLIGPFSDSKLYTINGDWSSATMIIGQYSGSRLYISNVTQFNYSIGDKVIWGGYSWTNLNGNTSYYNDILTLDTNEWSKDVYDEVNYYKVLDEIEYDYDNDLITKRKEIKSSNEVVCNVSDYNYFNGGWVNNGSPINVFQFGNEYNNNQSKGVGNIRILNSYFENINFIGQNQIEILLTDKSEQANVTYARGCSQEDIKISWGGYQYYINFSHNSSQSYLDIIGSNQQYINFGPSTYQELVTLKHNSSQNTITFEANAYQQSIEFWGNSNLQNITLNEGVTMNNVIFERNIYLGFIDFNSSTVIGESFQKTIYQRPDGTARLRYYNDSDTLVISDLTD